MPRTLRMTHDAERSAERSKRHQDFPPWWKAERSDATANKDHAALLDFVSTFRCDLIN
jgi:hypothetical protein